MADAERVLRRSVEIYEAMWAANPESVHIGEGLGSALNSLGNVLMATGRVANAKAATRRGTEIFEALWAANPESVDIRRVLGVTWRNLGIMLKSTGRADDAEQAFHRSFVIYQALWAANPKEVDIGQGSAHVEDYGLPPSRRRPDGRGRGHIPSRHRDL